MSVMVWQLSAPTIEAIHTRRKDIMSSQIMRRPAVGLILALAAFLLFAVLQSAFAEAAGPPRPETWVDGELFAGVVTPATFDPANGNFDELYNCGGDFGGFKDGKPLISESKPGDQDYNGGRWHLNLPINDTVCADKYSGADRVSDLDPDDFVSTDVYFECPLLPRRGK